MKPPSVCKFPGCGKRIWEGSASRLCSEHIHDPEHCLCGHCMAKRGLVVKEARAAEHPDRIKVVVSDGAQSAEVTLKRAPWEVRG